MVSARIALVLALLVAGVACTPTESIVAPLRYGQGAALPDEPFRAVAPDASPVPLSVPLPLRTTTLPNGVSVVLLERHTLPIVAIELVIARGAADVGAPVDAHGILTRALGSGSADRTAEQLSAAYARMGAQRQLFAYEDGFRLTAKVGAEDLDAAVALLAETAIRPRLSAQEVSNTRAIWLEDFANSGGDPHRAIARTVAAVLHGPGHPYGFVLPTTAHANALVPQDLIDLHARLFQPAHATLLVVGDATPAAVDAVAAKALGSWAPSAPALPRPDLPPPLPGPRFVFIKRSAAAQINVAVTARGPAATEIRDLAALGTLAFALGGLSSHLRGEVRVEDGAAYSLGAALMRQRAGSFFSVSGSLDATKTVSALRAMLDAIARVRANGVPDADFERARTTQLAQWRTRASSNEALAGLLASALHHGLPLASVAEYPKIIQSLTREELRRVAQRYLADEALHIVVAGNDAVRPALDGLGRGAPMRYNEWGVPVP
jgi:zinc protease